MFLWNNLLQFLQSWDSHQQVLHCANSGQQPVLVTIHQDLDNTLWRGTTCVNTSICVAFKLGVTFIILNSIKDLTMSWVLGFENRKTNNHHPCWSQSCMSLCSNLGLSNMFSLLAWGSMQLGQVNGSDIVSVWQYGVKVCDSWRCY